MKKGQGLSLVEELLSHKDLPSFTMSCNTSHSLDVKIEVKSDAETILSRAILTASAREIGVRDPKLLKSEGNMRVYRFF